MSALSLILSALTTLFATLEQTVLEADFTLTVSTDNAQSSAMAYPGTVTMQGRQFLFSLMGTQAAYDGATMYLYEEDTDELTLSTPTEEELVETNPLLLAQYMTSVCNVTERHVNPADEGSDILVVLTPKDAASVPFTRLTLRLTSVQEPLPVSLEMTEKHQTTLLKLRNARYTDASPSFRLSPPDAYVNDLRE